MSTPQQQWNSAYTAKRDFTWLKTNDLNFILSSCNIAPKSWCLDIGCGTGQVARDIFHRGNFVVGIDISEVAVNIAKSSTVYEGKGIEFKILNIESQRLDQKFDLITCKYVLPLLSDARTALNNVQSMLNKQGYLVIINPNPLQTPPAKKHISIPRTVTMSLLQSTFKNVQFVERGQDDYYFCS
ncbi:class I SAM-dependent methyltransferase [Candidatus Saccharibacteria bacterium]|nr:class I SAM-dependent methyltransferase [Candidatus Saccharibacteria bacterium]